MSKPDIIEVIGARVDLSRRQGRELVGLCPFHNDRRPSLQVNPEKQAFFCHPCGIGGDVITFIEKFERVDFKTACRLLNLTNYRPEPRPFRTEAAEISSWAQKISKQVCAILREVSDEFNCCSIAREQPDGDKDFIAAHEADLARQWTILETLDDDLNNSNLVLELWAARNDIENMVAKAGR